MAAEEKKILVRLEVDIDSGTAKLRNLDGTMHKLATSIDDVNEGIDDTVLYTQRTGAEFKKLETQLKSLIATTKIGTKEWNSYNVTLGKLRQGQKQLIGDSKSGMMGASQATGAATSATLELGRVFSDMPYGIRGVANNVSQLASNVFFMSKKVDEATGKAVGFKGALKNIGASLLGPAGILVAFQALVAILEANNNRKKTAIDLEKEHQEAIARTLELLSEYETKNQHMLDTEIKLVKIREDIKDLQSAGAPEQEIIDKKLEEIDLNIQLSKIHQEAILGIRNESDENRNNLDLIKEEFKTKKRLYVLERERERLLKYGLKKTGSKAELKLLKERNLSFEKEIAGFNKREVIALAETNLEKLEIQQSYERKILKIKLDTFIQKEELRKKDNKASYDAGKISYEDYIANNKKIKEGQKKANEDFLFAELDLQNAQSLETDKFHELNLEKHEAAMIKLREKSAQMSLKFSQGINGTEAGSVGKPVSKTGAEGIDALVEAYQAAGVIDDALFEEALVAKREQLWEQYADWDLVNGEIAELRYQHDLEIAQREIDLEQMKIDAKKNINQEYISWIQGLSSVFKDIAGENEGLAKAAVALEKGAAIAGIVINTQAANAKITAGAATEQAGWMSAAAQSAAKFGGGALGVAAATPFLVKAGLSAAAAKGRILKNNVGAGISIAKILSTTLGSGGSVGGGTSGGGGGEASQDRTFDFNLVGNTGVNQLAQGIGSQFDQPIQAYVVSSQMTSQQQMDATIQSNASIG